MSEISAHGEKNRTGSWTLVILILLYALALLDRQVLTLMVDPIKADLGLSDLQIGLLQGFGFSLFYSIAGLPIGWAVDRFPRRPIIWLGVTVWGLAAAACGLAQNFWQLLAARTGVGAGEASLSPAAYSMLADLFRPAQLGVAMSVLLIGSCLGNGLAVGLGGAVVAFAQSGPAQVFPIIGEVKTWQFVFIVTGLPGLVMGLLIFLVREPVRKDKIAAENPPLSDTFRFMHDRWQFFTAHFLGFGILSIVGWGFLSWLPAYMIRAYGWTVADITLPLALMLGIGSSVGTVATGWLVDRLYERGNLASHMLVYAWIAVGMAVVGVLAFQMTNAWLFLAMVTPIVMTMILAAIAVAALQIITPNQMRGQISAIYLLVMNGLGLGLGPAIVGGLTDLVFQDPMRLGASLTCLFGFLAPVAALALLLGIKPMRRAVEASEAWRDPPAA